MTAKDYWILQTQHDELVKVFHEKDEAKFKDGSIFDEELLKIMDDLGEMNRKMFELACSLGAQAPDVITNEWGKLDRREKRLKEMLHMPSIPSRDHSQLYKRQERVKEERAQLQAAVFHSVLAEVATTQERDD